MQRKTGQPAKESYSENPKVPAGEILGVLPLLKGGLPVKGLPNMHSMHKCVYQPMHTCVCMNVQGHVCICVSVCVHIFHAVGQKHSEKSPSCALLACGSFHLPVISCPERVALWWQ